MPRTLVFGIVLASIPTTIRAQDTSTPAPLAIVKTYCVSCHSGQAPAGRLSLDQLNQPPATLKHLSELFGSYALALCLRWRPAGPTARPTSPRSLH